MNLSIPTCSVGFLLWLSVCFLIVKCYLVLLAVILKANLHLSHTKMVRGRLKKKKVVSILAWAIDVKTVGFWFFANQPAKKRNYAS